MLLFSRRFHNVESSGAVCVSGDAIRDSIEEERAILVETIDAVRELLEVADGIQNLHNGAVPVVMNSLDEIRGWLSESTGVMERLSEILEEFEITQFVSDGLSSLICPVTRDINSVQIDDLNCVRASRSHLEDINAQLVLLESP